MPTMAMTLLATRNATARHPATATFRIEPHMTKWEVKEYLSKIYNLPVKKVTTANFDGRRRRVYGRKAIAYIKQNDWKRAIVTFDSSLKKLGIKI